MTTRPRPTWADLFDVVLAAVAVAAVVGVSVNLNGEEEGSRLLDPLGYTCLVVGPAALAVRRRLPVVTLAVTSAALIVFVARGYSGGPIYLLPLIGMFSVASQYERRVSVPVSAVATAAVLAPHLLGDYEAEIGWAAVLYLGWAAVAVLVGEASRNRRIYLRTLEDRARYLEETREQEAQKRVAEERLRIARDLHDVVAHSLSSINVQAGAGAHVIDQHPDQARESLLAIKRVSKSALGDLRTTLGHLRHQGEAAPLRPAPGLDQLDALVDSVAQAGLRVRRSIAGQPVELTPAVDVAAYRIVQESLTNVIRHAATTDADLSVTYGDGGIDIQVADHGRGVKGSATDCEVPGHGIAGMKERAAGVGGTVEAGPQFGGGFSVMAHLPLVAEPAR